MYVLVKTSIYCLTMPNNKRPEGVSDLVTRIQVVAFKLETPSRKTEHCKLNYSVCEFTFKHLYEDYLRTDILEDIQ